MTIKRLLFEGGTDALDATNANAGTSLINRDSGTIKFAAAAAHHGALGLELVTSAAGKYTIARVTSAASNNQMAVELVFAYLGSGAGNAPTAELAPIMVRNAINDTGVCRVVINSANQLAVRDSVNAPLAGAAVTVTPGTKYRMSIVMTGGSTTAGVITAKLYTADGTVPLGTWTSTTANLTANQIGGLELGVVSANQVATVRVDDVQLDDGRTTEIGPYDPSANVPPTVTAGAAQTVAPGSTVTLTSTASDSDGTIASRQWSFDYYPPALGSAPALTNGTQASATFVPTVAGLYVAKITVTDNLGATGTATTKIFVPAAAVKPIADTANPGGWAILGGAASRWAGLADANDATGVESPTVPAAGATYRCRLAPMPVMTSFAVTVRHKLSESGATGNAIVRLIEGSTVRKEWAVVPTTAIAAAELTMTPAECATVGSWNELDLEFAWAAV